MSTEIIIRKGGLRMNGYMGKILRVNLTTRECTEEPLKPKTGQGLHRRTGLGNRIIYDEVSPARTLSPENKIVFATGPVTATAFPLPPLPGLLQIPLTASSAIPVPADTGNRLQAVGYDALILEGSSPDPVYLWIHDETVEIRDASHLWARTPARSGDAAVGARGQKIRVPALARPERNRFFSPASSTMKEGLLDEGERGRPGIEETEGHCRPRSKKFPSTIRNTMATSARGSPGIMRPRPPLQPAGIRNGQVLDTSGLSGRPIKNWQVGLWKRGVKAWEENG